LATRVINSFVKSRYKTTSNIIVGADVTPVNIPISKDFEVGNYTVEEYAKAFIDGLEEHKKDRFRTMLNRGMSIGRNIADIYKVDYNEFIAALKKLI